MTRHERLNNNNTPKGRVGCGKSILVLFMGACLAMSFGYALFN